MSMRNEDTQPPESGRMLQLLIFLLYLRSCCTLVTEGSRAAANRKPKRPLKRQNAVLC